MAESIGYKKYGIECDDGIWLDIMAEIIMGYGKYNRICHYHMLGYRWISG